MKRIWICCLAAILMITLTACDLIEPVLAPIIGGTETETTASQTAAETTTAAASTAETTTAATGDKVSKADKVKDTGDKDKTEQKVTTTLPAEEVKGEDEAIDLLSVLLTDQYIYEWSEEFIELVFVSWQNVALDAADAAQYPKLDETLKKLSAAMDESAQETLESMLPAAKEAAAELGADFMGYSEDTVYYPQRADNRIFSLRSDYAVEDETGLYEGIVTLNLDPKTGETITIDSVVSDVEKLPALLAGLLQQKYPDIALGDAQALLEGYSPEGYTWTMNYQGVTFYFGAAELADAGKPLTATLWFDQYPEFLAESYRQRPEEGYVMMLPIGKEMDVDLNPGDDQYDAMKMELTEDNQLVIHKNGQSITPGDFYAYTVDAYLATRDNEKFFLYAEGVGDGDYHFIHVYSVSDEDINLAGEYLGDGFDTLWVEDEEKETFYHVHWNDPRSFVLTTRVELLGTMSGRRMYSMDSETGMPVSDTEYYTVTNEFGNLTAKIPVEVLILSDETAETVPEGTKFTFLRTDNKSYMDMKMSDGRECRIIVTRDGWQRFVNGVPEEDCFEGIMYAS